MLKDKSSLHNHEHVRFCIVLANLVTLDLRQGPKKNGYIVLWEALSLFFGKLCPFFVGGFVPFYGNKFSVGEFVPFFYGNRLIAGD